MRLTVGPLPPAVYWRRRAVVLGSLLVVIVLLVYSCNGSDGSTASPRNAGSTTSPPVSGSSPTESDASATPSTSATGTADPEVTTAAPASPTPVDRSVCTDNELLVTPVPAATQLPRGESTQIVLKIKNRSNRTCKRDVGPDLQELYIVEQGGAQKIWSSDDCGGPRGNKIESFRPGFEVAYTATWNGRESTNCKDRPIPEAGEYQVYGRLGTKRSDPVALTLT
jgi:hypothetical protein